MQINCYSVDALLAIYESSFSTETQLICLLLDLCRRMMKTFVLDLLTLKSNIGSLC